MPKTRFLTVYNYGTGGVWQWINAATEAEISQKYPSLGIIHEHPRWLTDAEASALPEYDIGDEPDHVMINFTRP